MSANRLKMPNSSRARANMSAAQLVSAETTTPSRASSAMMPDVPGTMLVTVRRKWVR